MHGESPPFRLLIHGARAAAFEETHMHITKRHLLQASLFAIGVALSAACAAEAPLGVDRAASATERFAASDADRAPELGACSKLQVPDGMQLAYHVYAKGVQIYRWDGQSWGFVEPYARLFADANLKGLVGTHYRGPKWKSRAGDVVSGTPLERCDVAGTIQWLLLEAHADERGGVFQGVKRIQRLATVGGTTPTGSGSFVGQLREVPYTAEYYFYR
jgi:hypothetical protein